MFKSYSWTVAIFTSLMDEKVKISRDNIYLFQLEKDVISSNFFRTNSMTYFKDFPSIYLKTFKQSYQNYRTRIPGITDDTGFISLKKRPEKISRGPKGWNV